MFKVNKHIDKKKIYYLAVFLITIFFIDRLFFFSFLKLEKYVYIHQNFKKQFIKYPPGTYDTLIMGSSRTGKGIHPPLFYKSLGIKARKIARAISGIKFNYKFYLKYRELTNKPKILIYGIDYFMFKMESNQSWMSFFSEKDRTYGLEESGILRLVSNKKRIDSLLNDFLNKLNNVFFSKSSKRNDSHRKNTNLGKEKLFNLKKVPDFLGKFVGFKGGKFFNQKKVLKYKKIKYRKFPGKEGYYFKKLLELLNKDKITVILVMLPDIFGTYKTNFQRDAFINDIEKLVKPYPNVYIYNYNNPKTFPLHKREYFLDGGYGAGNSHLSRKGSALLNTFLCKDLKKHIKRK